MRADEALDILKDIMGVCKDNNDDPIVVIKEDDEIYKPIKAATYTVGNGGNYVNLWTEYRNDDAITLSDLITTIMGCKQSYDRIVIDNKKEATALRIQLIDQFRVIEVV